MILLARDVIALKAANPRVNFLCRSQESSFRGYADHIGYFRYMGFDRGKRPGEALGSSTYIPIQSLDMDRIKEVSGDRPYAEIVEEKSIELAEILLHGTNAGQKRVIQYALREIMRNSVEHSLGSKLVVFGQYWPAKDQAEIVILDDGVGIKNTLQEAGKFKDLNNVRAIRKSLRPGVSSVSPAEMAMQDELWRNSGFGLYVTSEFCSERGVFRVISGDAGITKNMKHTIEHEWRFNGTCIQMKIDTQNLEEAEERINQIIAAGEEKAGNGRSASKSTRLLNL